MRKYRIIEIVFLFIFVSLWMSCDDEDNTYPYDQEIKITWVNATNRTEDCAPACIRMWALYDEKNPAASIEAIANSWGGGRTDIDHVVLAIPQFTFSRASGLGYAKWDTNSAYIGLANARIALEAKIPSIFPIYEGTHGLLFCGAQGNFDSQNKPIVKILWFMDPALPGCETVPAKYGVDEFLNYWSANPVKWDLREFALGIERFGRPASGNPEEDLKNFYRYNGTYYGGPASYIPGGSQFVRISFPIGTDNLALGQQTSITWESNGLSGNIKLELLKGDSYWGTIASNLPLQQGLYNWKVGQYQGGTASVGNDYKIKITMMDGSDYDTSNVDFSIIPALPDVVIDKVWLDPAAPTPGQKVTVKATIKNQGSAATPSGIVVGVGFKVDGKYLGAFFVRTNGANRPLAVGENYSAACETQWTATVGTHTAWVMADDINRFPESNDNNNVMEKSFTVSNALPDVVIDKVWLDPATPIAGQKVTVLARIKNQGTVATPNGIPVGAGFKVDGKYLGAFFVMTGSNFGSLTVGESYTGICNVQWTATVGTHTVWVMADDINRFPESNDNNNVRTITVMIK